MAQKPSYEELEKEVFRLKGVEDDLRNNEEKFRLLYERAPLGYQSLDENGNFIEVNQEWLDTFGYTREEVIGRSFGDFLHPEWVDHFKENFPRFKAVGEILGVEFEMVKNDGSLVLVSINGKIGKDEKGNFKQTHCILQDITSQKRSEEALRESEERYRSLVENQTELVCRFKPDGMFIFVNQVYCHFFNKTKEELIGFKWQPLPVDDDLEYIQERLMTLSPSNPTVFIENRVLSGKGDIHWMQFVNTGFFDSQGNLYEVQSVGRDITERKKADEALRKSEEKYRQLFTTVVDAIMLIDADTKEFLDVNDAALSLYGYSREEFLRLRQPDITAEPEASIESIKKVTAGALAKIPIRYHRKKDGTDFPAEISAGVLNLGDRRVVFGVVRDITERVQAEKEIEEKTRFNQTLLDAMPCVALLLRQSTREIIASNEPAKKFGAFPGKTCFGTWAQRDEPCSFCLAPKVWEKGKAQHLEVGALDTIWDAHWLPLEEDLYLHYAFDITEKRKSEAQFQRSQKMESLGLMAGGIAHDLNNILSGIVSYPELILMDLPEDSKLRKPIETIKDSGMRAADVVSDLLTIARGVASGKEVLNLNTMVEEYLDSAEHQNLTTMHSFITFKTDFDNDLLNIVCSSIHIKKSLTNLVTNAAEAIKGDGTVKISTMNRYLDEPLKGYDEVKVGEYAVLSVSDDGLGISEDDLERIFEPFYTKKVMGRSGTGLGLAVVWNTVQDHSGYININTSEKGTTFELYFPVTRIEAADEKIEIFMKDYIGHGERILVVDDEEQQREIACNILVRLDYKAEAVSSGEEAVEYLKKQSVDLVVLDMIMPKGINGRETYEEIIKIHPKQKAIIASGFSESVDVKKTQKLGAGKYIKKPYTMEKIGLAVKEELEK